MLGVYLDGPAYTSSNEMKLNLKYRSQTAGRVNQCVFLTKILQDFAIWHAKTCTKLHVNWHAQYSFLHVMRLVKKKPTCQLTLDKLTWHVLLTIWHWGDILEENVDVNWHSFMFFKTWCDTLNLKLNSNEICQTHVLKATILPSQGMVPCTGPSPFCKWVKNRWYHKKTNWGDVTHFMEGYFYVECWLSLISYFLTKFGEW